MRWRDGPGASEAPRTRHWPISRQRPRALPRQGVCVGGGGLWRPQFPRAPGSSVVRLGPVFGRGLEVWFFCLRQARQDTVRGRGNSSGGSCATVASLATELRAVLKRDIRMAAPARCLAAMRRRTAGPPPPGSMRTSAVPGRGRVRLPPSALRALDERKSAKRRR